MFGSGRSEPASTLPAIQPLTDTRRPAISTRGHYLVLTTRYIMHITRQAVLKASVHHRVFAFSLGKDRNYKCSPVVLADDVLLVLLTDESAAFSDQAVPYRRCHTCMMQKA